MSKAKHSSHVGVKVIKARNGAVPVKKADTSTQIEAQDAFNSGEWISPPVNQEVLAKMVSESSILPQCIRAYKNNIAGFGIGVRYNVDEEETEEMAAEFTRMEEIIELLTIEQDTKEIFEDLIEARETYGIAYLEVIRNLAGEVVQVEFIKHTTTVRMTEPLDPYIPYTYYHHGLQITRRKKYKKYRQQIGGKTVYYKEFGDPRVMDRKTGKYTEDAIPIERRANEIMEFAIGTKPYGEIRWIGQVLGVDGSRRAESLNNNYFINGRHTPLMIVIKGGTLTDESYDKLTNYMNDIKGENGQHAFIVLEAENTEQRTDFDDGDKPEIDIKDIASILQKDELFQAYLDNNRRRVQSAFLLPDLYVGYTTDFNRATALTAKEVTEEQVFQPERISLAWAINNRLLNGYQFKYAEAYFLCPDNTNQDDVNKLLTVCNNAGGLTPNKAKELIYATRGETAEPYDGEWGDIPLAVLKTQASSAAITTQNAVQGVGEQIQKAKAAGESDELIAVMKSVHKLLKEIQEKEDET